MRRWSYLESHEQDEQEKSILIEKDPAVKKYLKKSEFNRSDVLEFAGLYTMKLN